MQLRTRTVRTAVRPGRARTSRVRYVRAVGEVLAVEFDWDAATIEAFARQEARLVDGAGHDATFEFICDDPGSANWRLRFGDRPFELRLADYRCGGRAPDGRERRVNERLAAAYSAARI